MPRRGNVAKRDVLPDPVYNSKLVTRLINNIMYDGKKGVAQKIVYGAFPEDRIRCIRYHHRENRKRGSRSIRGGYGKSNAYS